MARHICSIHLERFRRILGHGAVPAAVGSLLRFEVRQCLPVIAIIDVAHVVIIAGNFALLLLL